jgi:hypothetical protein
MRKLMDGRDRAGIRNLVLMLHEYKVDSPYHRFMPPMVGTSHDVGNNLVDYFDANVNPRRAAPSTPVLTAHVTR